MTLPDKDAILAFVNGSAQAVGRREIARQFGIRDSDRTALRQLLREMQDDGLLEAGPGRSLHAAGRLPPVAVLQVTRAVGAGGIAVPQNWEADSPAPEVRILPAQKSRHRGHKSASQQLKLAVGDRILARISRRGQGYEGMVIRQLRPGDGHMEQVLGIVQAEADGGLFLQPVDRRLRQTWPLHHGGDVRAGELVRADIRGSGARATARVTERLGQPLSGMLSDIAIAAKGIPAVFPAEAEAEAGRAASQPLGAREDWTALPFLTIDPEDARDHDDAVFAEPIGEGDAAGWRLLVAIADVSWFVRPKSPLDREARLRGNSVYFPDRVVPMLPPALSTDACSLKAGERRAALVAALEIDAAGQLRGWRFHRAAIRVAANSTYAQAQKTADGGGDPALAPLMAPLWGCWRALQAARDARRPLELEIPEQQLVLSRAGEVLDIRTRPHLPAHQLIEDMMIAANVAAARALEQAKAAILYRCHDTPDRDRLVTLKDYLQSFGIEFALGQRVEPAIFNRVLQKARPMPEYAGIAEAVLRAQMRAYYGPDNIGHFGLSLGSYAHFTSPIRRYADLMVHRALVAAYRLGEGGLEDAGAQGFAALGEHLGMTERRAMEAERETFDRYVARHLAGRQGERVQARITGVQPFGFFATLEDFAGDGLVPVSALGNERFHFDEKAHALQGVESGTRYQQGQVLDLVVAQADVVTGGLLLALPGNAAPGDGSRANGRGGKGRRAGRPPGQSRAAGRRPAGRGSGRRR